MAKLLASASPNSRHHTGDELDGRPPGPYGCRTMLRGLALLVAANLLYGLPLLAFGCKDKNQEATPAPPPLALKLVAFDSALGPRGARPFVAGETVHLALTVRGGRAPYEIQVATRAGDPRLAAASATIQAGSEREISAGLELTLGSEVPSGTYALQIRITDEDGKNSSIAPAAFEVVGSDELLQPPAEPPLHLRVVDVAGRARRTFYQGEAIAIRATLASPEDLAIAIVASDEHPFMPKQRYPAGPVNIDLPLRVPRLARPRLLNHRIFARAL
ncbi:MAG: hypothetical protein GY811_27820 [Myxococcales bacterium]|nr:hypothetical protein [Myxococcales bacterium]